MRKDGNLNSKIIGIPLCPDIKIIISILPPLDYFLNKNEFVANLEKNIYSELDRIS